MSSRTPQASSRTAHNTPVTVIRPSRSRRTAQPAPAQPAATLPAQPQPAAVPPPGSRAAAALAALRRGERITFFKAGCALYRSRSYVEQECHRLRLSGSNGLGLAEVEKIAKAACQTTASWCADQPPRPVNALTFDEQVAYLRSTARTTAFSDSEAADPAADAGAFAPSGALMSGRDLAHALGTSWGTLQRACKKAKVPHHLVGKNHAVFDVEQQRLAREAWIKHREAMAEERRDHARKARDAMAVRRAAVPVAVEPVPVQAAPVAVAPDTSQIIAAIAVLESRLTETLAKVPDTVAVLVERELKRLLG